MPKYLFQLSYTAEGTRGLVKEGGSSRLAAAEQVIASVGGKLESLYFALGDVDAFVVADLPDDESAAAGAMTVASSGVINIKTTKLLTPEQIDAAAQKHPSYRPPGG